VKIVIEAEMKDRWVPHFLGMLAQMEWLGNIGSSRNVTLFADGDGDFRPKFTWDTSVVPAGPKTGSAYDETLFDAG